jgi:tetratricopeptide (TPR) repeat protein/cytoskeletal protein CcmA (bactofilin family)
MDSYFGKGVKLTGTLWAKGDVHFDADIVGEVFSESHFFVGESGFVDGDLHVYDFSNSGEVKGNIFSENKTRLMLGSNLKGNISTYQLVIDEGADFEGRCKMIDAPPVAIASKSKNLSKKPNLRGTSSPISSLDKTASLTKKKLASLKSFGFVLVGLMVVGIFLLRYPWSTGFENSLRNGYKLLKKNQYKGAEKEFNKALRINIDSPEVYAGLGETFYQNKRYKDSITQFKKAIELKPSNSDYKIKLAMAYDMSEKLTDAETFYRLAIDANPGNANAYYHYGIFVQARGDLNDAVNNFRKATKLKKGFYQAHHLLGNILMEMGKKDEATEELLLALKIDKNNSSLHLDLGNLYLTLKNQSKAEYHFKESIKASPQDFQTLIKIAGILKNEGIFDKSIALYKDAALMQPKNADIQVQLGNLYAKNNPLEALSYYKNAVQLNPNNPDSYYQLGRLLFSEKQFSKAREALEQGVLIRENHSPTHYELGRVLLAESKFVDAEKSFSFAVKYEKNNVIYVLALSDAQIAQKKYDLALEAIESAIKINPKNPVSVFAACKVYSKKRFYTIAIEHCEKALVLNPNGLNLMNRLAWLYAKKSIKLELALELINKSIKVSPDRADFIDTLSEVLFVQGKVIMAEKAISKAIKLKPNNAYYKQQLRRFKNSRLIEAIGN